jgi:hypothetical protein
MTLLRKVYTRSELTFLLISFSYNHFLSGDLNILLVVFQAIVAVIAVEVCKLLKWVEYPSFSTKTAKEWVSSFLK